MKKNNCNPFAGAEIPPCSDFLGNVNPIIKDGELIFRNSNQIYCFIGTTSIITNVDTNNSNSSSNNISNIGNSNVATNLQISIATFLIGVYINQVELGNIKHSRENKIHNDKGVNNFINDIIENNPNINVDYTPNMSVVVSNTNAILALYSNTITISPLNYYILFILNRLENDPALFFGNNAYTTEDPINFTLASIALRFPFE